MHKSLKSTSSLLFDLCGVQDLLVIARKRYDYTKFAEKAIKRNKLAGIYLFPRLCGFLSPPRPLHALYNLPFCDFKMAARCGDKIIQRPPS